MTSCVKVGVLVDCLKLQIVARITGKVKLDICKTPRTESGMTISPRINGLGAFGLGVLGFTFHGYRFQDPKGVHRNDKWPAFA